MTSRQRSKQAKDGKRTPPAPEPAALSDLPPREPADATPPVAQRGRQALDEFFVNEEELQANLARGEGDIFSLTSGQTQATADLLAFWVAHEEYAVEIVEIQEIIKVPEITEVPRAPAAVLGIISLRGTIVPVVDMRTLLHLPRAAPTRATRVLVLRGNEEPIGLLVDRVSSVVRLDRDVIEPVPRTMLQAASDLLHGVGRDGDRMLILLDLEAVLNVLEAAA